MFKKKSSSELKLTVKASYMKKEAEFKNILASSLTVQALKLLIRAKFNISEDEDLKLFVQGGKVLEPDGEVLSSFMTRNTKVLVLASKKQPQPQHTPAPAPATKLNSNMDENGEKQKSLNEFDEITRQLEIATGKLDVLKQEVKNDFDGGVKNVYEKYERNFLWFNCVVELMTKLDKLKQEAREEYDKGERGRSLIKRCSSLLDDVERLKKSIKS